MALALVMALALSTKATSAASVGRSDGETYYVPIYQSGKTNSSAMPYCNPANTDYNNGNLFYNSIPGTGKQWAYNFIAPIAVKTNFNSTLTVKVNATNWAEAELDYVKPQDAATLAVANAGSSVPLNTNSVTDANKTTTYWAYVQSDANGL